MGNSLVKSISLGKKAIFGSLWWRIAVELRRVQFLNARDAVVDTGAGRC
jgi:hypothetical protein